MAVFMQTDLNDVPVSQEGGSSDFSKIRSCICGQFLVREHTCAAIEVSATGVAAAVAVVIA